jgi:hypothetical protein
MSKRIPPTFLGQVREAVSKNPRIAFHVFQSMYPNNILTENQFNSAKERYVVLGKQKEDGGSRIMPPRQRRHRSISYRPAWVYKLSDFTADPLKGLGDAIDGLAGNFELVIIKKREENEDGESTGSYADYIEIREIE